MTVSTHDRDYMRRLARYKADSHAEATARHHALTIGQRLRESWQLFLAHRDRARKAADADVARRLYELARARGLYRP